VTDRAPTQYPFDASPGDLRDRIEQFVDATCESLSSYYLVMPRGDGFVDEDRFRKAFAVLDRQTSGLAKLTFGNVMAGVEEDLLVLVVLRCILGLSPSEWAHLASEAGAIKITQGAARSIDQRARAGQPLPDGKKSVTRARIEALVRTGCDAIVLGAPFVENSHIHRFDKFDTRTGAASVLEAATKGVPYATLLYERLLGRPFASHRDAVSEHVGDILESAIQKLLVEKRVPFHKTGRAERIDSFDQAPDFIIPSVPAVQVVIEAKLTEDDGTARDKITRVQHLCEISRQGAGFEVIACVDGRGFSVRGKDIEKLLLATNGKVFTLKTLDRMTTATKLSEFIGRS